MTYSMRAGATVMGGWALPLLWADRDPIRRKGVLPLTSAVVLGLVANDTAAARAGKVRNSSLAPMRMTQTALLGLFTTSYLRARNVTEPGPSR